MNVGSSQLPVNQTQGKRIKEENRKWNITISEIINGTKRWPTDDRTGTHCGEREREKGSQLPDMEEELRACVE